MFFSLDPHYEEITLPTQIRAPCPKAKLYRSMFFARSVFSSHLSGRNLSVSGPNTDSSRCTVHACTPTFAYLFSGDLNR